MKILQTPKLHIVSFDVPFPADYGGAIDVFYKIKALAEAGCEIYLHCFQYGRKESEELNQYCKEVWYYKRITGLKGVSLRLPYIVRSRRNRLLLQRLKEIEAPVLFEGIHSCYYLHHPDLANRLKMIRTHNIEHQYYRELQLREKNFFRRIYFKNEAYLLKKFEAGLDAAGAIIALSQADQKFFSELYPRITCEFIPPFHPFEKVESMPGKGRYCLYHGNLAHPENEEAALFLLKQVIPSMNNFFIIAGNNPCDEIVKEAMKYPNCRLVIDPDEGQLEQLLWDAHIHILPTFQRTGMKLKLLYALFSGKHLLVNEQMLHGTGISDYCIIANSAEDFIKKLKMLLPIQFTEEEKQRRQQLLNGMFSNQKNAERIITLLQQKSP